ncbi:MAG: hypothetical protein IIA91_09845, partial [Chloroflexi bacterium]|nr:hypothetical protein [Chloroflexota bacterium]
MQPLFEAILKYIPPPAGDPDAPLQMLVAALDYDNYLGQVSIGRVTRGTIRLDDQVTLLGRDGQTSQHKLDRVLVFRGLGRSEVEEAQAGDIVAVTGVDNVALGDTITVDVHHPRRVDLGAFENHQETITVRRVGELAASFQLTQLRAESAAFAQQLVAKKLESRRISFLWIGFGTLFTLALCGALVWMIVRNQTARIQALKLQARKLRDSDFGELLP